jgi:hypothetical protein
VWFDGEPARQWRYFSHGVVDVQTFLDSPIFRSIKGPVANQTVPSIADPVDLSADGRWLLVGGWQGPVVIDLQADRVAARLATGAEGSASVGRFEPDGSGLWVGQGMGPLQRHSFAVGSDGRPVIGPGETVPGHEGFLPTALHAESGVLALTDYRGGRVRLLGGKDRRVIAEWALPKASHAAFSPDGRLVLTNGEPSETGRVEVREVATGRVVQTLGDQAGRVAAWSADGRWVLAGTGRNRVGLWRTDTWAPGPALPEDVQNFSFLAAFSPDGRLLAIRGDQTIAVFRVEGVEPLARLAVPDSLRAVPAVRFTRDGRRLIVARMEGRVDLWDLATMRRELAELGLDWKD